MEILEDCPVVLEDWHKEITENENSWAIRAVKFWFTLHKEYNKLSFARLPNLLDDNLFIEEAIKALPEGEYDKNFFVSETEKFELNVKTATICKLLVDHIGGTTEIDPQADGSDDSLGAYMMFVVRDVMKHFGMHPSKTQKEEVTNAWLFRIQQRKLRTLRRLQKRLALL